ncbi:GNAT family protein [Frankia sp. Cr2]|uniref:GNAT family N-acetyltransferase n=1 Tax=Frankia sp. Cr2 TaxID=3073932 RepID=UPI002AD2A907|nr:GNAT family protein [Frankia sp. Cr2]
MEGRRQEGPVFGRKMYVNHPLVPGRPPTKASLPQRLHIPAATRRPHPPADSRHTRRWCRPGSAGGRSPCRSTAPSRHDHADPGLAVQTSLAFGFTTLAVDELVTVTDQGNIGMNGIARKLGMVFRDVATVGPWQDNNVYAVSRADWEARAGG